MIVMKSREDHGAKDSQWCCNILYFPDTSYEKINKKGMNLKIWWNQLEFKLH